MPGPAPKDPSQRRRRNATVPMVDLPAEGRQGPPPAWPLPQVERYGEVMVELEARLWAEVWATPQAVAWERMRWHHDVALYVRWTALAQLGSLDAGKEARMLSDRLGLSPMSMLRLRWRVVEDEVEGQRSGRAAPAGSTARRRRLRAIDPGQAG